MEALVLPAEPAKQVFTLWTLSKFTKSTLSTEGSAGNYLNHSDSMHDRIWGGCIVEDEQMLAHVHDFLWSHGGILKSYNSNKQAEQSNHT